MSSTNSQFNYRDVSITASSHLSGHLEAFSQAPKFQKWIDLLIEQGDIEMSHFSLTDINWFGPPFQTNSDFSKVIAKPSMRLQKNALLRISYLVAANV